MHTVLVIAIEDRVDLWLAPLDNIEQPQKYSAEIPECTNYYAAIHQLIAELFQQMCDGYPDTALSLFCSVKSTVVSVPGVVEGSRKLLQIPLWHSREPEHVTEFWKRNGVVREHFDFSEELSELAHSLIKAEGQRWDQSARNEFEQDVFVVNDASACAAFEASRRRYEDPDFFYLKIHNGINVGIVQGLKKGHATLLTQPHPETGHGFPRRHRCDLEAKFTGICEFHKWCCFDGMVAANSWCMRVTGTGHAVFRVWNERLEELENDGLRGQELDNAFVDYLLGKDGGPESGDRNAIEIFSYYVGQLTYQLALLAPTRIVVGGRMATPAVMKAIRHKVVTWASNYPRRNELTAAGITGYIVSSAVGKADLDSIEAQGALVLAVSRTRTDPQDRDNRHVPLVYVRAGI